MSQPTHYTPNADFSQQEANNASGRSTVNTAALDAEFAAIETTLDQTLANLQLIQRDDGQLKDTIVSVMALDQSVINLMGGWTLKGAWLTVTDYAVNDIVSSGEYTYVCLTAHHSGVEFDSQYWSRFGFAGSADAAIAAAQASASAASAATSATTATNKAASATSSATAAATSAGNASAHASAATTKAGEAAASATNAANSAAKLPNLTVAGANKVVISNDLGLAWEYKTYQDLVDEVDISARGAEQIGYLPAGTGAVATDAQSKLRESVSFKDFGAVGDGATADYAAISAALTSGALIIDGGGLTYKSASPISVPVGVSVRNAVFDLTALTTQTGLTTRVGSRFENIKLLYSSTFSGIAMYFTTADNASSTSVVNADSNRYIGKDLVIEKQMPSSGIAWDWYTAAAGVAIKWDGVDNPDGAITSGFWGGLLDNVTVKGVWLQAGLITDDNVAWITSSAWRHITIDGARRGIEISSGGGASPKSGNLLFDDVNMQGWRWTKSLESDVVTEWMLKVTSASYCDFKNFQPQDFDGAMGITNYIQFGANSKKCYFQSTYITTDSAIQDSGSNNWGDTLIGRSFANLLSSANTKTLDYYAEGSFTPEFAASGLTLGYAAGGQNGYYTRIGNRVHFNLYLNLSSLSGTPSGALTVTGLPFASSADTGNFCPVTVGYANLINSAAGYTQFGGYIGTGGTTITLQYYGDNVAAATVQAADITSTSRIMLSGSYKV